MKVVIPILILFLIGSSFACQTDNENQLANEELEIYKTLLADKPKQIVVVDPTRVGLFGEIETGGLKDIIKGLQNDTFESLAKRNSQSSEIDFGSIENFGYQIVDQKEVEKNEEMRSRYYIFSRVGFSSNGKQAVVMFIKSCAALCSKGAYYLLLKENGIWKIVEESETWRS